MASAIIHIAIAKKVAEKVKVDNLKDYYLGAIAPDVAKQVGSSRTESHFIKNSNDIPNIKLFIKRYPFFKYNSFDLGYFTHLYADKIWNEYYVTNIKQNDSIKLLDGTFMNTTKEEYLNLIYADYTNLNIDLITKYDIDLSLFYEDFVKPKTSIVEIPVDKLDILINKMSIIIANSKQEKTYLIDIYDVVNYIEKTANEIIELLKKY
ncbi:MAG: zinc dependent phospholipase C family protein [Bacilli bacterium]|nr:zinc dependent phospholipase C family protein [Bacilli bacterium]